MSVADIHFLYVIAAIEDGLPVAPCKIGITKTPATRLSAIQTGNHKKLVVVSFVPVPSRLMVKALEQSLHEHFEEFRLAGEWFDMCPIDAVVGACAHLYEIFQFVLGSRADDAFEGLGIPEEMDNCFKFIAYCERNNLPLKTRLKGRTSGSHTQH